MALSFSAASTTYLQYADEVTTGYPFTLSFWFRSTSSGSGRQTLFRDGSTSTSIFYEAVISSGYLGIRNPSNIAYCSAQFASNTWTHALLRWNSTVDKDVFINAGSSGRSTGSQTYTTSLNTTIVGCAITSAAIAQKYTGQIADAAMWNTSLSTNDIYALSKGFTPLQVRPESLAFYMPIWANEDSELLNAWAFTRTGSPTVTAHPGLFRPVFHNMAFISTGISTGEPGGTLIPQMMYYYNYMVA